MKLCCIKRLDSLQNYSAFTENPLTENELKDQDSHKSLLLDESWNEDLETLTEDLSIDLNEYGLLLSGFSEISSSEEDLVSEEMRGPSIPPNLSLLELQELSLWQRAQLESQARTLNVKDHRIKVLRQQDSKQISMASEYDRLRRLREKVEGQELKLRKLRALRGIGYSSECRPHDLNSLRNLVIEKEKELSSYLAKVSELHRQLEELHRSGVSGTLGSSQMVELERLRREVAYRRQLNEQQNSLIAQQREQISSGQSELNQIDIRIVELSDRLSRKRLLNSQLAAHVGNRNSSSEISSSTKYQTLPFNTKLSSSIDSSSDSNGNVLLRPTVPPKPSSKNPESSDEEMSSEEGFSRNRMIEMPSSFHFPENGASASDSQTLPDDVIINASLFPMMNQIYKEFSILGNEDPNLSEGGGGGREEDEGPSVLIITNTGPPSQKSSNLKAPNGLKHSKHVTFDPLALLLDACLDGELELVQSSVSSVADPSACNDEGITALHNAICAGHFDIVSFLVSVGVNVNATDSDGWTPLHCAASCNNLPMVKFLVEHGAALFATTYSDSETAAQKCEEDEEGFDGTSEYLYSSMASFGDSGPVYALYSYSAAQPDELNFTIGDSLLILSKESDGDWWMASKGPKESPILGLVPKNYLGLSPRVVSYKTLSTTNSKVEE